MRQHASLAAAGTGKYQQMSGLGANRFALAFVQGIYEVGYVH